MGWLWHFKKPKFWRLFLPSAQKSAFMMAYAHRAMMHILSRTVRIPVMTTPPLLEKQRQHLSGHCGQPPLLGPQQHMVFHTIFRQPQLNSLAGYTFRTKILFYILKMKTIIWRKCTNLHKKMWWRDAPLRLWYFEKYFWFLTKGYKRCFICIKKVYTGQQSWIWSVL